jgi:segregation and condensation protein A
VTPQQRFHIQDPAISEIDLKEYKISVTLFDLLSAFSKILKSLPGDKLEGFQQETITVQQKIEEILQILTKRKRIEFMSFLADLSTRLEIIITFLAVLELVKSKRLIARQSQLFGGIWLYPVKAEDA